MLVSLENNTAGVIRLMDANMFQDGGRKSPIDLARQVPPNLSLLLLSTIEICSFISRHVTAVQSSGHEMQLRT